MVIAICDDEVVHRENLIKHMQNYSDENIDFIIKEFESGEELVEKFNNGEKYDIVFLDICMGKITGVDVATLIRKVDKNVIIFFVTSFDNYTMDAFRVNAFQFLVKPFDTNIFNQEFKRAIDSYYSQNSTYTINFKNSINTIKVCDIMFIETYLRNLRIITIDKKTYEFSDSMDNVEMFFEKFNFVRCHKSFIVNLNFIESIKSNDVILKNYIVIPVSKNKRKTIIEKYNLYLSGVKL